MNQKGNALFLILIAVALFAALSYAVTQSGRGGSGIDKEKATLGASRLMQYGGELQIALQRMQVVGGVSRANYDFETNQRKEYDGDALPLANTSCADETCEVFSANGGGMAYESCPDLSAATTGWAADGAAPGHSLFEIVAIDGIGTSLPEIVLRIPGVMREVCEEINSKLNLPLSPSWDLTGENYYPMSGASVATNLALTDGWTFGDDADDLDEAYAFCIDAGASGTGWEFYHVLVIR